MDGEMTLTRNSLSGKVQERERVGDGGGDGGSNEVVRSRDRGWG